MIARDRRRLEARRDVSLAYLTAKYVRGSRLPTLASELEQLDRATTGGDQTIEQQRSALAVLSEQTGIPLRRGKPEGEIWNL